MKIYQNKRGDILNIAYFTSEAAPFFKTGGLADVVSALPQKMAEFGHEVSVFMPKYIQIPEEYRCAMSYCATLESHGEYFNLYRLLYKNVQFYFIENRRYYERERVYGNVDEDMQYALFCELSLRFLKEIGLQPDILHCNDWQTGPLPYFLRERYKHDQYYWGMKSVFTIHNLMYQGKFSMYAFHSLGYFPQRTDINYLEVGIESGELVTTVSPTYAQEIQYPYFSEGLEWITQSKDIRGVLNGIDTKYFNPKTNKDICHAYSVEDEDLILKKQANKRILQQRMGLPETDQLLVAMVTRLVEGKGLGLVKNIIEEVLEYDAIQLVVLGSGEESYEAFFEYLTRKYPDKCKIYIGYNEALANQIYAGSDLFLMPSRYEPCGLSQMIAMRFGTPALVRSTGGLKDTVHPYNEYSDTGNGFSFDRMNAHDLLHTLRYAEHVYYDRKEHWHRLVYRNMKIDFSWNQSALRYLELYEEVRHF